MILDDLAAKSYVNTAADDHSRLARSEIRTWRDAFPGRPHTSHHHRGHTPLAGKPPASRVPNLTGQYT
ncbi:hypothetical protein [Streptomyces sp. NPDC017520]|uniref:hypothetical protein n=1 Tax=Streptomyces sp. NPDC017520 TaxID=3364998 RepID=UPI003794BA58